MGAHDAFLDPALLLGLLFGRWLLFLLAFSVLRGASTILRVLLTLVLELDLVDFLLLFGELS